MRVLILHGGIGARLRPISSVVPKGFIRLAGDSAVERILEASRSICAIPTLVIPRNDTLIPSYLKKYELQNIDIRYASYSPMDSILQFMNESQEPVVVWWGDSMVSINVRDMIKTHESSHASASMALWKTNNLRELKHWGSVTLDEQLRTYDHPVPCLADTGLIKAGVFIFDPPIFPVVNELGRQKSDMSYVINTLLHQKQFYGIPFEGYKVNLNYGHDLIEATYAINTYEGRESYISPSAILHGRTEVVGSGTSINAEAFIENGVSITNSVILEGAIIHENATIVDSVIAPGAEVKSNAFVYRSMMINQHSIPLSVSPY